MTNPLAAFAGRIEKDFLPAYCRSRGYALAGFKHESIGKVTVEDARDFLRALDAGLVEWLENGRYRLPKSSATEVLFWEGLKSKTPRPITLWLEPVITLAAIARLHLDFGWPKELLGTQAKSWAFDLSGSLPDETEYLVGEVKKTQKELDSMLRHMQTFSDAEDADVSGSKRNAHKKWRRLSETKSSLFWAVGPGGISRLFEVERAVDGKVALVETELCRLQYPT